MRICSRPDGGLSIRFGRGELIASARIAATDIIDALKAPGITADPENPIFTTHGENVLKNRLRAHLDVAAIHCSDLAE